MADIAASTQKINDLEVQSDAPLSEALLQKVGGAINRAFNEFAKVESVFAANGNWVCPLTVTQVLVAGVGGGGGGGAGSTANGYTGQGGMAGVMALYYVDVIPGQTYPVVIGGGGAGGVGTGSGVGNPGSQGGSSTFAGKTFVGGIGGQNCCQTRVGGRGMGSTFRSYGAGGNGGNTTTNTDGFVGGAGAVVIFHAP